MRHVRLIAVAALVGAGLTMASAQDKAPQVERHELMESISDNAKILGDMAKGEVAYDAAKAEASLDIIVANIKQFPTLFPEGTETGHDTRALPAIWEDRDAFESRANALAEAAEKAREAAPDGQEAFASAFRDVGRACGACHDSFRAAKS